MKWLVPAIVFTGILVTGLLIARPELRERLISKGL